MYKIERSSIYQIGSAFVLAIIVAFPYESYTSLIAWIIYRISAFVGTLFHELGHTVFYWLYGIPAIPGIMTIIGSDQASGMTMQLAGRMWFLQIVVLAALGWFCYHLYRAYSYYFYPFAVLFGFILLTCFTGYHHEVISYMGHGGAILVAGIFLFKAFTNSHMRNSIERWLNAFFGFFLILQNFFFSYGLIFTPARRLDYITHKAFGTTDMDFVKIAASINGLTLNHVAWFTIILCIFILALTSWLSYLVDKENKFLALPEAFIKVEETEEPEQIKEDDLSNF